MSTTKYPEIEVEISGQNGNAFVIIGLVKKALEKGLAERNMHPREIQAECDKFYVEATSGNYNKLLQTCIKWVTIS